MGDQKLPELPELPELPVAFDQERTIDGVLSAYENGWNACLQECRQTIARQALVIARVEALADEWDDRSKDMGECAIGLRHALGEQNDH